MACLSAEITANNQLFIQEDQKKAWVLNEELYDQLRRQLQELKVEICKQCKKNFELEKEVKFFDQRIALLINHKISVEEFPDNISYGEHRLDTLKDDIQKQCFGNLFFLLQTEPKYIAKLTRSVDTTEIDELLQIVMFSLYGNQYGEREEHLLLKMFELALNMEFDETDEFGSLMRQNTAISRMMTTYTRRGPGQEYLKDTLQELVEQTNLTGLSEDLNLEVNPVKVYCALHSVVDDERNNVTMEKALKDKDVKATINARLVKLENITKYFFDAIIQSLNSVPYGIRWLCKAIYQLCQEKFPHVSIENITGLIGGFFLLRFINPAIVFPHNYMLLNSQPRSQMRRNFVLIAKLLQAISNKGASQILKEVYMKPLEAFVESRQQILQDFLMKLCNVDDFHSNLEMEQYLSLPKDMNIRITLKEMYRLHDLLCKYQDFLTVEDNEKLTVLLLELGDPSAKYRDQQVENVSVDINLLSRWDVSSNLKNDMINDYERTSERGIKALRKRCQNLLTRLLTTAPYLMQELTLKNVFAHAYKTGDDEIERITQLVKSHLDSLKESDPNYKEEEFYVHVKDSVSKQEIHYDKMSKELKSLKNVQETLIWHGEFLSQQLDAYKEYLQDARNKAAVREGRASPGKMTKQNSGPYKFSYTALEKEGVIFECKSISYKKKQNIAFTVFCKEPGIYTIQLHYKIPLPGQQTLMELDLHLEDLLNLQHFDDPVYNINEYVVLDVRRTLSFLHKYFGPKKL
uniref:Ras-GAP domain-containing protein n=2 Tax=Clytia hemisphaerica TaxID=252671 RepID=A0A7M5UC76_9CNID